MRRSESLHPSALLVDQHGRIVRDRLAEIAHEATDLIGMIDVALEEDQSPRQRIADESALVRRESKTGQTGNEGARVHRRGLASAYRNGQAATINSWGRCTARRRPCSSNRIAVLPAPCRKDQHWF